MAYDVLRHDAFTIARSAPAEETLRTAAERAAARGADKVERVPVEGEPVKSLIGALEAHQADLLVVGNRGLNTIAGRLLGSVPAAVSRRSPCDVLIVHTVS
jgi:nucleotide-binding universal stress UspA family protein